MMVSDFNVRMRAARKAAGLSYEAAAARASRLLPDAQEFTSGTLRRKENGPECSMDPLRCWALAQVYGVPLEYLSPTAARWFAVSVVPTFSDDHPAERLQIAN